MKDFNEFIRYSQDHISEIQYDTINHLKNEWNPELSLSQADVELVSQIASHLNYSFLRQYHHWLHEDET